MTAAALLQSRAPLFTAERAKTPLKAATARRAWVRIFCGDEATGAVDHRRADTWGQLGWAWVPGPRDAVGIMGEGRQWLWRHPHLICCLALAVRPLSERADRQRASGATNT